MGKKRRHGSWWTEVHGGAPTWAIVGTGVVLAGMLVVAVVDQQATIAAQANAPQRTPAPEVVATLPPIEAPPTVAFIGDSYTAGSAEDSGLDAQWQTSVRQNLGLESQTRAYGGVGYAHARQDGTNFATAASEITGQPDVVLVFGSRNDVEGYDSVRAAADALYTQIREKSPASQIVVVGPPWVDANPPEAILASRDAVRDAAAAAGIPFVDPIADQWFVGDPTLIGADGVHPNDAGHAYLADKLAGVLAPYVG